MSDPTAGVVCDAGPLIHLDELDSLWLLNDFQPLLVPVQVWQEVAKHRPQVHSATDIQFERINVTISTTPTFQAMVLNLSLALGEQAALTLMHQYPDYILLTDDAAARLAATNLGYRVHGTIGILIRSIRRGQHSKEEVIALLRQLPIRSTLHIRPRFLEEVIGNIRTAKL